jgi:radical SAM superfamily enzyme YgiQ (UPF0313 family)
MMRALLVSAAGRPVGWQQMTMPPLGVLYLGAALRQAGHEATILDAQLEPRWRRKLVRQVCTERPDFVGFSLLSNDIDDAAEAGAALRAAGYDGPIIGGGPGASWADETTRRYLGFDAFAVGEAERTVVEYADAIAGGSDPAAVPGLVVRRGDGFVTTPPREPIANLDALPYPAYDLSPLRRYFGRPSMDLMFRHRRWAPLLSSRSCPFDCAYCAHALGHGFRPRSPENLLAEIDWLVERHGVRELQIIDDVFNLDRSRVEAICEGLLAHGHKLHLVFPNGLRLDRLDNALLQLMVRAGFDRLLAPLETSSPEMQQQIGKHLDVPRALAAVAEMAKLGVTIRLTVMLGFPGETLRQMRQSVDTALATKAQFFVVNQVMPLPGSRFGREYPLRAAAGEWRQVNFVDSNINLSDVPMAEIDVLRRRVVRHMLRPRHIWRTLRTLPLASFRFYPRILLAKLIGPRHVCSPKSRHNRFAPAAADRLPTQ